MAVQGGCADGGVDRRDDAVEAEALGQQRIGHDGLQDRCRIGQACGLDDQALESRHLALHPPLVEVAHAGDEVAADGAAEAAAVQQRSEEHTSELQSLMRISYAVFCLKKKNSYTPDTT